MSKFSKLAYIGSTLGKITDLYAFMPDYALGSSDLNSVSHACMTNTVHSKPSPYPLCWFVNNNVSHSVLISVYDHYFIFALPKSRPIIPKEISQKKTVQEHMNHLRSFIVIITHTYFLSHPGFPLTRAQVSRQNGHRNRTVAK